MIGIDNDGSYRTLLESTRAIPWKLNWETKLFEYIGPQIEELLGWSQDSWKTAMDWIERIHPDDREQTAGLCISQSECGVDHEADYRALTADGGYVWVRDVVHVLRENGKTTALVGFIFDISERKRLELALTEAKEQAEAASRAKSEFLATMSHEIRTPMNGILGMLRLLLDGPLAIEQRDRAETARHSAESLLTILNDILDFSKLEAGKLTVESIPFDLPRVVTSVVELMRSRAHEKGLELTAVVESGVPAYVQGDPTRLRQVLLNLVGNAVKFTDAGRVQVNVGVLDGGRLRISVSDTGIGIAEEARQRLFAEFVQADGTIARRFGGTGLGLAICRRLITLMGGSIAVDSEPGKGSTFRFDLPLPACAEAPYEATRGSVALPPLRVLLAEDNLVNQKVVQGFLSKGGHRVSVAQNGARAVELARSQAFDIILMDMQMPEMDGLAATRAIRKLPPPAGGVPIIALTANAMQGDAERCIAAGMNAHVAKPIDPEALFSTMASLVSGTEDEAKSGSAEIVWIETSHLYGMRHHLGDEALQEVAESFLRTGGDDVAMLIARSQDGDLAAIVHYAHDLKGMAGCVGATALANFAAAIEVAAKEGDLSEARALIAGLPHLWEKSVAQLQSSFHVA